MDIPGITDNRVTIAFTDGIADVRLNRPDKRNALDSALFASLAAAGEFLKSLHGLRAVVLSGEGPSFCAAGWTSRPSRRWHRAASGMTVRSMPAPGRRIASPTLPSRSAGSGRRCRCP